MSPAQEMTALIEALAIGMWCRGSGHDLVRDEVEIARRAMGGTLEGPLRDAQAILAATAACAAMTTIAALRESGVGLPDDIVADLLGGGLPKRVVEECEIELCDPDEAHDDEEDDDDEEDER